MYRVNVPFKFYHNGIDPTQYGEGLHDLPPRCAEVAIAEGWAVGEEESNDPLYIAKHRGGGKWDVHGPDGVAVADLNKDDAKAKAEELNGGAA